MNKLDISKWKDFKIKDLFITEKSGGKTQVPTGSWLGFKDLIEDGITPRITVSSFNNGITGYYNCESSNNNYRVYNNFISVSFLGTCFYQEGDASLDMKVHCLKPLNTKLNKAIGKFLVTIIRQTIENTPYSDQISSTVLPELSIYLPVDKNYNPDWEYMETYITELDSRVSNSLKNLDSIKNNLHKEKIDILNWKEFNMSDIGFKNFHGIRQKQSNRTEGDTPLLTAGKEKQGVASYIGNPLSTYIDSITVDMFGNSFFHKGIYAGDDNVYFFVNDDISDEAKLFIAAVINTDNTSKYGFKDQFRQPQANTLSVHLPTTTSGQPDWNYMEDYIKLLKAKVSNNIENLS